MPLLMIPFMSSSPTPTRRYRLSHVSMAALSSERSTSGGGVVSSTMMSMSKSTSCVPTAMTIVSS